MPTKNWVAFSEQKYQQSSSGVHYSENMIAFQWGDSKSDWRVRGKRHAMSEFDRVGLSGEEKRENWEKIEKAYETLLLTQEN